MYEMHLFCTSPCISLPAAGVFSALGCGARRGPACTLQSKIGPRPGSVARALGVQSRSELPLCARSLSAEPEPTRHIETPKLQFVFCALLLLCTSICYEFHTLKRCMLLTQPRFKLYPL